MHVTDDALDPRVDAILSPWEGRHGGMPPFSGVTPDHLKAALEAGLRLARDELAALAVDPAPPTFDNTVLALDTAFAPLGRACSMFNVFTGSCATDATDATDALENIWRPRLAAFDDEMMQNATLFERVRHVFEARQGAPLAPDALRLLEHTYRAFVRGGATLDAAAKAEVKDVNQRLATLYARFAQNVRADEQDGYVEVKSLVHLAGLPAGDIAAARQAAVERGLSGWAFLNTRSAMEPVLKYAAANHVRKRAFELWTSRGDGGAHDNKPIIAEILALRRRQAQLLGYESFAHKSIEMSMARTPEAALQLLQEVWPAAVTRVKDELAAMRIVLDLPADTAIEPWDYRYCAEKVRKARYDIDENELRPYLQLPNMLAAMFDMAKRVYGLTFTPVGDAPVFHADVSVY